MEKEKIILDEGGLTTIINFTKTTKKAFKGCGKKSKYIIDEIGCLSSKTTSATWYMFCFNNGVMEFDIKSLYKMKGNIHQRINKRFKILQFKTSLKPTSTI